MKRPIDLDNAQANARRVKRDWRYVRSGRGDDLLAEGKGLSPAFLKLLGAVGRDQPLSALAKEFPHLDDEDLEIWLAELMQMGLIKPWLEAGEPAAIATGEISSSLATPFPTLTAPDQIAHSRPAERVRVLLVDRDANERNRWRKLLVGLPLEMDEAGTLEAVNTRVNTFKPRAVLLGNGEDFEIDMLLGGLKRQGARRKIACFVMTDSASDRALPGNLELADAVLDSAKGADLMKGIATHLGLPLPDSHVLRPAWETALYGTNAGSNTSGAQARQMVETQEFAPVVRQMNVKCVLEENHPRVLVQIADFWGNPRAQERLGEFLNGLIIDDRGDRVGFSAEVMDELLFLNRLFRENTPTDDAHSFRGASYFGSEARGGRTPKTGSGKTGSSYFAKAFEGWSLASSRAG